MRYLSLGEVLDLHRRLIEQSGGSPGLRDVGGLQSALAQPAAIFGGDELHPTVEEKAATLCYSLVMNHPFIDGNKRLGHAAMETFLLLNGLQLEASVDDAEQTILTLAAGKLTRDELLDWVRRHVRPWPM